jgi:hypothetical protein
VLTSEEWEKEVEAKVENAAKTTEFQGDRVLSADKLSARISKIESKKGILKKKEEKESTNPKQNLTC